MKCILPIAPVLYRASFRISASAVESIVTPVAWGYRPVRYHCREGVHIGEFE